MTAKEIAIETDKVFNELYSLEDIIKGNTIEMKGEARKIAIKRLKKAK